MSSGRDTEVSSLSAIEHILTHRPERIRRLILPGMRGKLSPRHSQIEQLARAAGTPVEYGGRSADEGARTWVAPYSFLELREFLAGGPKKGRLLALDHVQDTQNLGALCRTAEALGFQGVVVPKDRGAAVTSGTYSTSAGAIETIPLVQVANLGEGIRKLKEAEYWIVGTTLAEDATAPEAVPDFDRVVLLLGAEHEGMSPLLEKLCDWKVRIPLTGKVQSLNVSAAGAVLMYLIAHKQGAAGSKKH